MFSHPFYNVVHVVGIVLLMAGLGGLAALGATAQRDARARRFVLAFHGTGAFLILLGGFGMLARLGIVTGWPGWVWGKLVVWVVLAFAAFLPLRVPRAATPVLLLLPLLGGLAAWLAIYKPF